MKNAAILLLLHGDAGPADIAGLIESARTLGAHISAQVLSAMPVVPVYAYGLGEASAYAFPDSWAKDVDVERARLDETANRIGDRLSEEGLSFDVNVLMADPVNLGAMIARRTLTADLVAMTEGLRADETIAGEAIMSTLFHAPAGLLLHGTAKPTALNPRRVLVAWNAGMPAARAVRVAMPILEAAEEVTVVVLDPVALPLRHGANPGSDIARWLSHRQCNVVVKQDPTGGKEIAEVLKDRAREVQADLIVMGAYQHSRLREFFVGGTTRSMIEQTEIPVLMAH